MEDYKNAPESISELKAYSTENMADWTPRDVLVSLLRDIDSGMYEEIDCMVVAFRERKNGGGLSSRFRQCGPDIQTSMGLMEIVKLNMMDR